MTTNSRIRRLHDAGVSVWLDDLSRPLLDDGVLERYVTEHGLSGVTSNPTIFAAALRGSDRYDAPAERLLAGGVTEPSELFLALALEDVADAASLLRDTYELSDGRDGYVSFECTPDVADDAHATVRQAEEVWARVDAPNLMIKVPATGAGIVAIEELTAAGINVNVTLLFSAGRYEQAARAYQRGLARRAERDEPVDRVRSVASVFVSRVDARVEPLLGNEDTTPPGTFGIANAHLIYARALELFDDARWRTLRAQGAHWQRPLWASTAPKNPDLRDVAYVESLALPGTIVTVPEKILLGFADHGAARPATSDSARAKQAVCTLARQGIDLETVGEELERAGVDAFGRAYADVLESLGQRAREVRVGLPSAQTVS
jgi:transaldolase